MAFGWGSLFPLTSVAFYGVPIRRSVCLLGYMSTLLLLNEVILLIRGIFITSNFLIEADDVASPSIPQSCRNSSINRLLRNAMTADAFNLCKNLS